MRTLKNRLKRGRHLLAAPIVFTTTFAPACQERAYTNPERPEMPEPSQAPPDPTIAPTGTPSTDPSSSGAVAVDPPIATSDPKGRVEKQPDGTCLYFAPPPDMTCPPNMQCNPGPPTAPRKVKCPDGAKP